MMMAPLSSSHGRSGQRTPYLRQTSSVCGCRCPRRCRTCPASKYDAPGVLGHHQQLQLASLSGLLSLSLHAPPCPPLARARPQATRTPCTRRRTRVFWPVGLLLGCCSCERWAGARGQGGREGDLPVDKTMSGVMKRMCLSTQSVLSASPASTDTIRSTCLSLGSALEAAVLVVAPSPSPSPSPSAVSRSCRHTRN